MVSGARSLMVMFPASTLTAPLGLVLSSPGRDGGSRTRSYVASIFSAHTPLLGTATMVTKVEANTMASGILRHFIPTSCSSTITFKDARATIILHFSPCVGLVDWEYKALNISF